MTVAAVPYSLPSLVQLAAALRTVTERLGHELVSPQPAAPEWSEFEWRTARAVAAMHGISGVLAGELWWRGPDGWTHFLSQQRAARSGHTHRDGLWRGFWHIAADDSVSQPE